MENLIGKVERRRQRLLGPTTIREAPAHDLLRAAAEKAHQIGPRPPPVRPVFVICKRGPTSRTDPLIGPHWRNTSNKLDVNRDGYIIADHRTATFYHAVPPG